MSAPLTPGRQLGTFVLDRKLALGGMAEIWVAHDPAVEPHKPVALKVMFPDFARDPNFRAMFWDEVHIAQRLSHVHIARVFDAYEDGGYLFQVLELLDGIDVRRLMSALSRERVWLPTPFALMIARDMARGLNYAHLRKDDSGLPMHIVHRDISPHNVMVTRAGIAKVLDFGIARARERLSRTRTGVIKGKISYMAPEQALGTPVDARTDIFSTGVVLWEMLAMDRLFRAPSDTETLQRLIQGEVPRIESRNSTVPEDAAKLIHAMLSVNPSGRPNSMNDVENQLNRVLARTYSAEQVSESTLAAWVGKYIAAPGAAGRRKTAIMPAEENTERATVSNAPLARATTAVTDPSAPTDPDDPPGPPTQVDLVAPDFDDEP